MEILYQSVRPADDSCSKIALPLLALTAGHTVNARVVCVCRLLTRGCSVYMEVCHPKLGLLIRYSMIYVRSLIRYPMIYVA